MIAEVVTLEANTAVVVTIIGCILTAGFLGLGWMVKRVLDRLDEQDERQVATDKTMSTLAGKLGEHMKLEELDHVHRAERQVAVNKQLEALGDGQRYLAESQHEIRERLAVIESHITPEGGK